MATDNTLSVKIASQLPSYLQDEGPNLVAFMKAYYEWLESEGQVNDRAQNLLKYNDVDDNINAFIDYFNREILTQFPSSVLVDRRLLMKNVRQLYQAKGSENAFRLLFRLLYNEEILFYFPGDDILRTSDGRWTQETVIRVSGPFTGDLSTLGGQTITGRTSGATARVLRVTSTTVAGVSVFVCSVEGVSGTFVDGEQIRNVDSTLVGSVLGTIGPIQGVNVSFGGSNNQLGDIVSLTSSTGGTATGVITQTTDSSLTFNVVDGGSGYTTNSVITISEAPPGTGASFTIASISNTELIAINTDTVTPAANIVLNTGPTFASGGANTGTLGASFASANISSTLQSALTFQNTVFGSIGTLAVVRGAGYTTLPTINIVETTTAELLIPDGQGGFKGLNANVQAAFVPGAIETISITSSTGNFLRSENVTIVNQTRSATNARGVPIVTGTTVLPGAYTDTRGFLSWNNKLQDSTFYQKYSYVIQSTQNVDAYRRFVLNTIHPAGLKLFGQKDVIADLISPTISAASETIKSINITSSINVPTIVSSDIDQYISDGTEGALDSVPGVTITGQLDDLSVAVLPSVEVGAGFTLQIQSIATATANAGIAYVSKVIDGITIDTSSGPIANVSELTIDAIQGQLIGPFANTVIGTGTVELPKIGVPTIST
jgi:hypothetical protein